MTGKTQLVSNCVESHQETVCKDKDCNDNSSRSAGRKPFPTMALLESEKSKMANVNEGKRFRSRAVIQRLTKQSEALKDIATNIHHGDKNDLIHSLAASVSRCKALVENDNS